MDDDSANWCAVCDRQILPMPQPTNPPPSPTTRRGIRQRTGLVHGTGRVRPNGQLKATKTQEQGPAPLYCSDTCRQQDLEFFHGAVPVYPDSASSDTSSDDVPPQKPRKSTPNTRSLAVLQREYSLDPLPARTSETYDEFAPRVKPTPYRPPEFTSGVMMANRRLEAVLPKALKPGERAPPLAPVPGWTDGSQAWRASTYSFAPPPKSRADILDPNRAAYQSFVASPHRSAGVASTSAATHSAPASPTASSITSSANSELLSSFEDSFTRRTSSRLSLFSAGTSPSSSTGSPPRNQRPSSTLAANGMLLVPDVFMRSNKRTASSDSLVSMALSRRRNSNTSTCSSASASAPLPMTASERAGRRHSAGSFPGALSGRRMRSPLSGGSVLSVSDEDDDEPHSAEDAEEAAYVRDNCDDDALPPKRPTIETRSWSYDNVRTYPVMAPPPIIEKRRVLGEDGVTREVEVEVQRPFKKLFTFEEIPKNGRWVDVGA